MRDHSHHIELSRDEAVQQMLAALPANFGQLRPEQVSFDQSVGRVLAEDVRNVTDLPNTLTCALDSIAVHWSDFADLPEGALSDTSSWVRGVDWEFANTGIAMPEGFDTAIVIEHASVSDDEQSVVFDAAPSAQFAGTRPAGSKGKRGDVAVAAGCVITPDTAASIASAGHNTVLVRPKPKVAFIPTGNELVAPGLPYAPNAPSKFAGLGKVYESNSAVVRGKVEAWGGTFVPFDIVPDEREAIAAAVQRACQVADIVILNAGSSKGSDDWSVEVLEEMGRIICHQTNHGPGHHSSYALVDETPIAGISGPAAGASFTLNFYLLPLMQRFLGQPTAPRRFAARLINDVAVKPHKSSSERTAAEQRPSETAGIDKQFFGVKLVTLTVGEDGTLEANVHAGKPGSPGSESANGLTMVASGAGAAPLKAGDIIQVELRNPPLA